MSQILFFATRQDLLVVLSEFETNVPLQYMPTETTDSQSQHGYSSAKDIPRLGVAAYASAIACESYLIVPEEIQVRPRKIQLENGGVQYAFDQLQNPDTITLTPGGLWKNSTLLNGRVSSASTSKRSQQLLRRLSSLMKTHFIKIKAFYVGPEALNMLKCGTRLAGAVQSPKEYDLTL